MKKEVKSIKEILNEVKSEGFNDEWQKYEQVSLSEILNVPIKILDIKILHSDKYEQDFAKFLAILHGADASKEENLFVCRTFSKYITGILKRIKEQSVLPTAEPITFKIKVIKGKKFYTIEV